MAYGISWKKFHFYYVIIVIYQRSARFLEYEWNKHHRKVLTARFHIKKKKKCVSGSR